MRQLNFDENDLKKIFRLDTPTARTLRLIKRILYSIFYLGFIFILAFILMNLPAYWKRATYQPQKVEAQPVEPEPTILIHYDPEILIAKLGLKAPIVFESAYDEIIPNLKSGVVRYTGTAMPGQLGNLVIVGHSSDYLWSDGAYKTVFALLDKMVVGDEIIVRYQTNEWHYTITESTIVKPTDLTVLNRTENSVLTLITCYPVGTAKNRLVVKAKLQESPVGSQQTSPYLGNTLPRPR